MANKLPHVANCALRGASIGAPVLALCAFVATYVYIPQQGQIPPNAAAEGGLFVGAVLGALIGVVVAYRVSRCIFYALLAVTLVASACTLADWTAPTWANVQRWMLIALIIGVNGGLLQEQKTP